jgi:hypothetical protein
LVSSHNSIGPHTNTWNIYLYSTTLYYPYNKPLPTLSKLQQPTVAVSHLQLRNSHCSHDSNGYHLQRIQHGNTKPSSLPRAASYPPSTTGAFEIEPDSGLQPRECVTRLWLLSIPQQHRYLSAIPILPASIYTTLILSSHSPSWRCLSWDCGFGACRSHADAHQARSRSKAP